MKLENIVKQVIEESLKLEAASIPDMNLKKIGSKIGWLKKHFSESEGNIKSANKFIGMVARKRLEDVNTTLKKASENIELSKKYEGSLKELALSKKYFELIISKIKKSGLSKSQLEYLLSDFKYDLLHKMTSKNVQDLTKIFR